jgi:hypothetical protein
VELNLGDENRPGPTIRSSRLPYEVDPPYRPNNWHHQVDVPNRRGRQQLQWDSANCPDLPRPRPSSSVRNDAGPQAKRGRGGGASSSIPGYEPMRGPGQVYKPFLVTSNGSRFPRASSRQTPATVSRTLISIPENVEILPSPRARMRDLERSTDERLTLQIQNERQQEEEARRNEMAGLAKGVGVKRREPWSPSFTPPSARFKTNKVSHQDLSHPGTRHPVAPMRPEDLVAGPSQPYLNRPLGQHYPGVTLTSSQSASAPLADDDDIQMTQHSTYPDPSSSDSD